MYLAELGSPYEVLWLWLGLSRLLRQARLRIREPMRRLAIDSSDFWPKFGASWLEGGDVGIDLGVSSLGDLIADAEEACGRRTAGANRSSFHVEQVHRSGFSGPGIRD